MRDLIRLEDVKNRFVMVRGELSLLAGDVAALYGVEPREVAQTVKNNPAKFPKGYVIDLTKDETESLKSKFLTLENAKGRGHYSKRGYKAFTEKGLYMLATITTQLLHRKAQAHRPPRETGRRGSRMTQTAFYKNWSRPTLCKLWVASVGGARAPYAENWQNVSDTVCQNCGAFSPRKTRKELRRGSGWERKPPRLFNRPSAPVRCERFEHNSDATRASRPRGFATASYDMCRDLHPTPYVQHSPS